MCVIPAKFAELLAHSLRRDAFVMEAFNYEEPAVAGSPEFKAVFDLLYRQLAALYGDSVSLVLAIDAHGCRKRNYMERERTVVTGAGLPAPGCRVFRCAPAPEISRLKRLSESLTCAADILNFCFAATPAFVEFFSRSQEAKSRTAIIAPYLVRSVSRSFAGVTYQEITGEWADGNGNTQLMYTHPYTGPVPSQISNFEGAYFSAALCVFVPSEFVNDEVRKNFLEALHLSFQISWGLPALEEQKRESALFVQDQQEFRRRYESIHQMRSFAHAFSREVQGKLDELVRQLDPGSGLDHEDIADLFEAQSDGRQKQIWQGRDVKVRPQHDYAVDKRQAEANIYFAVHRAFDKMPNSDLTFEQLSTGARCLVENAECSITTRRFYNAILAVDRDAFNFLKAIVFPIRRPRQISLYSFAVRLFLDAVAGEELKVNIYQDSASVPSATLDAQTFLRPEFREHHLDEPRFEQDICKNPGQWAFPLSKFIGIELSGALPKQKVFVRRVDLVSIRNNGMCRVVCPLICNGSSDHLAAVKETLKAEPQPDGSSLNEALLRLAEARTKSENGFNWCVTEENELVFSIGRTA